MLRTLLAAVLALTMSACEPDLPQNEPSTVVTAVFDPTTSQIPLPNDLVFLSPANGVCPESTNRDSPSPACTQADLLVSFSHYAPANAPALSGEFPNDQEVAITIDFTQTNFAADHQPTHVAPDLDLTTLTSQNLFVVHTVDGRQEEMPLAPITDSDYVKATDNSKGTLTIHHAGRTPWPPGSYSLVMRGGSDGVKTKAPAALPVTPSQIFYLLAQDKSLTDPNNLGLLKAQTGSTEKALEQGMQLEVLRLMYDASAFPVADTKFPHQDLAIAVTFKIAPEVTNVVIDPARGQAPLPIDLLRDLTTKKLSDLAACTLAGAPLDGDGKCTAPAAAGFKALDGFSTTGAILGPTSDLVRASSVTKTSVLLYDLTNKDSPVQVSPDSLIIEPCEFTSACGSPTALSPVIAIQPAGATAGDPTSVFRTRPLKDNTDYAVVITTDVLDKAGNPLGSGTAAKLLKFVNPVVLNGHAGVQGLDDATALALEDMRAKMKPTLDTLAAAGTGRGKVAIAYTFHTQTILSQGVQLAALPYTAPASTALPTAVTASDPGTAFSKFHAPNAVPKGNIDEILETDITTFNLLDPMTGAFHPNAADVVPESIHVLIATPKVTNPNVPACAGNLAAFGKCAPMIIFRHGLTRGRADMLLIADSLAAAGMVTVAIDAAKHGDRAFCISGATGPSGGCNPGVICNAIAGAQGQGDAQPPGHCADDQLFERGLDGTLGAAAGVSVVSGNYLISANFFRTRDSLRQDLIDESQLVRAIAFVPSGAPPTGHTVFDHIFGRALATPPGGTGMIIDPAKIYYSGQSLGAIQGVADVATNPRISKAVFNVGGGTIVDIFTNSPAFATQVNQLLAGLGIVKGTAQYLQFLVVAKTILDPADPINFAGHLTSNTLPNLLANPVVPQAPKKILNQMANCDGTIPNPFSLLYASNITTGPLPTGAAFFAQNLTGTFQLFVTQPPFDPSTFGTCPAANSASFVEHGFLLDFANPTLTANAQRDLAAFVRTDTLPLSVQHQ